MPQPTLLNFFNRTPKANSSPSAGTSSPSLKKSGESPNEDSPSSSKVKSSPSVTQTPDAFKSFSTPVSRSRNSTSQKRRRTSGQSNESSSGNANKKLKNDDSPSGSEDFSDGSMVWALIEGYPWWPAMIRGEEKGDPCSRQKTLLEFHVQFFDDPPTRAWIRKGDLKPYIGSQDANIPPTKNNRSWVTACNAADKALALTRKKRMEKYWIDFNLDEERNGEEIEDEVLEEPDAQEGTPKSRRDRNARKHKRVRQISTSSEEGDVDADKKYKKNGKPEKGKVGKGKKDESDDEYSPTKTGSAEEESDGDGGGSEEIEEISEAEDDVLSESEDDKRKSKKSKTSNKSKPSAAATSTPVTPKSLNRQADVRNKLQQFNLSDSVCASPKPSATMISGDLEESQEWEHMTFPWAKEGNRKDSKRRKENDPDYDPRTLYVPEEFLRGLTPGMRQWWDVKMKNFDTILFFKVGKFYEFYHWDACIAVKELGFTFMKGKYAHSGFPEVSFSRFANALVEKGYKIARIEQTETPAELDERVKKTKPAKQDRVIRREVCQISTKGVRYASFQDEMHSNPFNPQSAYLYAIVEKQPLNTHEGPSIGVCFIDTTIGTFHLGQFCDDRHLSRLRTLFSHHVPAQVLYEKGKLSGNLQQLLFNMQGVRKDPLTPESEFWGCKKVLKYLAEQDYFRGTESTNWPESIQQILSKSDGLGLTPDENWELGVKCLGGIVAYLKYCLLDHDLLSQKRFEIYTPVDDLPDDQEKAKSLTTLPDRCFKPKYMVLDGITLRNLEILEGPLSLLSVVDKCGTNFGKRLLRHWLCLPLALPEEINSRLDAIEDLMNQRESRGKILPLLKSLPDLERLLSKIHYLGSAHRSKNHPDGRANFFEDVKYSKNKINDLTSTLRGFKVCVSIIKELKKVEDEFNSDLLQKLIGDFPHLDDLLNSFDKAYDHQKAAKDGKIEPKSGVVEEYDSALEAVQDIQNEAEQYLKQLSKDLKTRAVYFGSDKKRFQIEVSDNVRMSKEFEMSSSRKGYKRYYNKNTKEFLSSIMKAEADRDDVLRDIARKIFEKFDIHRETWSKAVECISTLDVLVSLSLFSESQEEMCRPVVSFSSKPFINIVEGRHPCVASDSYIPNDTILGLDNDKGKSKGSFVILTGPNMGGKSTLMRQIGLLAVLSHLGCYVPAEKCEMSIVDRIFTRLGANDNIGEGESTFFVEMSETSAILRHASSDSLLLIDELGRGTATYDGTAIAYATAKELSGRNCRALFSTHYHTLVESLQDVSSIQMSHMACMVENENEEDPTQESITFLYKMISGPCPKSYGFNAARLAGISDEVIRVAHSKAKEFESMVNGVRTFTNMCASIREEGLCMDEFAALKI